MCMVHAIIIVITFKGFNVMILTTFFLKEKNQNNVNIWNVTIHKRCKYGFIIFKFYNDGLIYYSPHLINVISKSKPLHSNHVQDGMEI
jgi:hypothetical protein